MALEQSKSGVAVITGAAGGMGSAAAVLLAAQGWPLLLCDINPERLETVAGPLRATAPSVEILAGDLADPAFPTQVLAALGARQIGALIHTAGLSPTMGDAARIFSVNYDASERLVKAVCPRMAEGSCAVLISSSSAYLIPADMDPALDALMAGDAAPVLALATRPESAYPLSKKAVIRLVAREAAAFGARKARIASISPGLIDTPMNRAEQQKSAQMATMLAKTPLGRMGEGEEIASVAVFLCSPAASYISGCDIKVDGGMLAALGR